MKKRKGIILISAICLCVLLLIIGVVVVKKIFFDADTLTFTPESDIGVNYNNYVAGNGALDYRYGKFAWRNGNDLTVVDDAGTVSTRWWGNYSFQLYKDGIVYLQFHELMITDENNESLTVAKNVTEFMVFENSILYSSENGDVECLYLYDLETMTHTKLITADEVVVFCASNDKIYVLTLADGGALSKGTLTVFKDGVNVGSSEFHITSYPFYFMVVDETMVYEKDNALMFYDLNSGKTQEVKISDRTTVDNFVYILNDRYAFVSYQALKYNGSLTSTAESEFNGLWMIDLSTMQKEKISDEIFYELMLYSDDFLVGINSEGVFHISKDGNLTELIK